MDKEQPVDFSQMTLEKVAELVGRPIAAVNIRGKWIECVFAGTKGHADTNVLFRKW